MTPARRFDRRGNDLFGTCGLIGGSWGKGQAVGFEAILVARRKCMHGSAARDARFSANMISKRDL